MLALLPTAITVILFAVSSFGLPDLLKHWISENPDLAAAYAAVYALGKGLLPSPMTVPMDALKVVAWLLLPFGLVACTAAERQTVAEDLVKIEAAAARDLALLCKVQPDLVQGLTLAANTTTDPTLKGPLTLATGGAAVLGRVCQSPLVAALAKQ